MAAGCPRLLPAPRCSRRSFLLHLRAHRPEPRPRYVRWVVLSFFLSFAVGAALGAARHQQPAAAVTAAANEPSSPAAAQAAVAAPAPDVAAAAPSGPRAADPPPHRVVTGALESGQTLAESLQIRGISADRIHVISREMAPVLDFRYARPGDHYRLVLTPDGDIDSFHYDRGKAEHYELARAGDHWVAKEDHPELVRRRSRIAGVVSTSLYSAIEQLGEDRELAEDFSEIFAWDIDFSRGAHRGDEFSILYERLYVKDAKGGESYVRPGRILAARYTTDREDYRAVYFETEKGRGAYYGPDGQPMERQFLKAPLDYKRISSEYSFSRLHPILGIRRPHLGIDYAAPFGTPVWSVGNGEVIFRGYQNGFGNLVKIRHANGYVSYYAHLSRFAPSLGVGQAVHQKQVIGYVGSTGLSTGPHLCFRLAKEGSYVNPALLHARGGDPIPAQARERFETRSEKLLAALDPRPLVTTNEAL
jgi:murein DD-endopeptidase MepM/ murein hydrolase activator NlpD